ncbi:4'-phosphopantetheinyl transferase superfamily protein [Streptomyces nitrosporeus]|uniref:4'-phosphopantetheinyl transferase superfamily protein n=1 Tax=Streptomyces nitrosporeus TaxID=28894 RepID=A0A5J6FAE8_9ACTN|nr:4'-phosphopantetheinyl transferase superfamily protein [Streptomyces nitrosporeus]
MIHLVTADVPAPHGPHEQHRAGRAAAADALRRSGSTKLEVGRRPDGAPVFPAGFAGSIAHTPRLAVAAVCRAEEARGVGVDLETDTVQERLHRILLREEERESLWVPADEPTLRRLFVAKEAAFKAFSACEEPVARTFWRIRLEQAAPGAGRLLARAGDERAWVRVWADSERAWAVAVLLRPEQTSANRPVQAGHVDALGRKGLLDLGDHQLAVEPPVGQQVDIGETELGPGVDREVGGGQQQHPRDGPIGEDVG